MSMEVRKESNGLKNSMVTREELAIINQFTKRALKEDEVYTFAVRLCDNEVDRDGARCATPIPTCRAPAPCRCTCRATCKCTTHRTCV